MLTEDTVKDITLSKGLPLYGIVCDPAGIPLANTYLEAVEPASSKVLGRAISDEGGSYRITLPNKTTD